MVHLLFFLKWIIKVSIHYLFMIICICRVDSVINITFKSQLNTKEWGSWKSLFCMSSHSFLKAIQTITGLKYFAYTQWYSILNFFFLHDFNLKKDTWISRRQPKPPKSRIQVEQAKQWNPKPPESKARYPEQLALTFISSRSEYSKNTQNKGCNIIWNVITFFIFSLFFITKEIPVLKIGVEKSTLVDLSWRCEYNITFIT